MAATDSTVAGRGRDRRPGRSGESRPSVAPFERGEGDGVWAGRYTVDPSAALWGAPGAVARSASSQSSKGATSSTTPRSSSIGATGRLSNQARSSALSPSSESKGKRDSLYV